MSAVRDQQAALDWVGICTEALAAGHDWRADSDRYIRALPTSERIAPYLFAVYLARRQQAGDDPRQVLDLIEHALIIIATAERGMANEAN